MMYHDTSMAKAERLKVKAAQREAARVAAREAATEASIEEFEREVSYIRKLQAKTSSRQKVMAQLALELFSVLTLQKAWRQCVARMKLLVLKTCRHLVQWTRYWVLRRTPRLRATIKIQLAYKVYKKNKLFWAVRRQRQTIARLQSWYRFWKAHKVVARQRVVKELGAKICKRAFVFGTTRAVTKVVQKRIVKDTEHAVRFKCACIIIRFLHRLLQQRKLQLLNAREYANKLHCIHVVGVLGAKSVFESSDPTLSGLLFGTSTTNVHNSDEKHGGGREFIAGESVNYTAQQHMARRGGVAPLKKPTLVSGKIAKNQPAMMGVVHKTKPTLTGNALIHERAKKIMYNTAMMKSWREHLLPHAEIILYILSRIRPYDGHAGRQGGTERDVSKVFEYLVNARRKQEDRLQKENDYAQEQKPFTREVLLRNICVTEGMAGRADTRHLLPVEKVLVVPENLTTASATGTGRRGGIANSLTSRLPRKTTTNTTHDNTLTLDTLTSVASVEAATTDGKENPKISPVFHMPDDLLLPRELRGIFMPRTIVEVFKFVVALKNMVLAMPKAEFDRVVGRAGREAHDMPEDQTNTQDCCMMGEVVRLGQPSKESLQAYTLFHACSQLGTASRAKLRDLRQEKRVQSRSSELAFGALVIVDGKDWSQQSMLLEEAQAAQETMNKFYSRPGDRKVAKVKAKELSLAEKLAVLRAKNSTKKKIDDSDDSDNSDASDTKRSEKIFGPVDLSAEVMKAFLPQAEPETPAPATTDTDAAPKAGKKPVKKGKGALIKLVSATSAAVAKSGAGAVAKGKGGIVPKPPAGKPGKARVKPKLQVVQPTAETKPEGDAEPVATEGMIKKEVYAEVAELKEVKPEVKSVVYSYFHDDNAAESGTQSADVKADAEKKGDGESKEPVATTMNTGLQLHSAKVAAAAGVFSSNGDRKGGRSGHLLGENQPNLTREQREAKDLALQMLVLSRETADKVIPEVYKPDFSSAQYSSEFTRSALLHWQLSANEKGGTPEAKVVAAAMKTTPDKAETPPAGTGEDIGAIESEETQQETLMEAHAPVGVSQRSVLSTNQLRFRPIAAATLPLAPVPEMAAHQYANGIVPIMPEIEALNSAVSPFVARRRRNRNGPNT